MPNKRPIFDENQPFSPLWSETGYAVWREKKLHDANCKFAADIVPISNLGNPDRDCIEQILTICRRMNFAIYELSDKAIQENPAKLRRDLTRFCEHFGLITKEHHRSEDDQGVVALEVSGSGVGAGYIPYTDKPLSWHTDGYYNQPSEAINAMVLHCARNAMEGGHNQLLDPEIAYIRLRDENPHYITALMHDEAMCIPENNDTRSAYRPVSIGPVFKIDPTTGSLGMRYTSRTRSILWRDDDMTRRACAFLTEILSGDPLVFEHQLKSGQGIISNNVLHNRTRFIDSQDARATRLMYRIRYRERINGT